MDSKMDECPICGKYGPYTVTFYDEGIVSVTTYHYCQHADTQSLD